MIAQIIADYLIDHRRLTVPGLGTFIVKNEEDAVLFGETPLLTNTLVFSELLNTDDGVLRGLVKGLRGLSDLEATGLIDRFVFETRYALTRTGRCEILPLGTLRLHDGVISIENGALKIENHAPTPIQEEKKPQKPKKGRRMDAFTWVGIVVIVLAASVVAYTFYEEPIRAFISQWI